MHEEKTRAYQIRKKNQTKSLFPNLFWKQDFFFLFTLGSTRSFISILIRMIFDKRISLSAGSHLSC